MTERPLSQKGRGFSGPKGDADGGERTQGQAVLQARELSGPQGLRLHDARSVSSVPGEGDGSEKVEAEMTKPTIDPVAAVQEYIEDADMKIAQKLAELKALSEHRENLLGIKERFTKGEKDVPPTDLR
jgi:hypothetical protein